MVCGVCVSHVLPLRLLGVTLTMLEPMLVSSKFWFEGLLPCPIGFGLPRGLARGLAFGLKLGAAGRAGFGRPVGWNKEWKVTNDPVKCDCVLFHPYIDKT